MKIVHLILISFFFILLLFSITTYINYKQSELIIENVKNVERSTLIVRNSNRFQGNFLNMVSGLRGYLLTEETSFQQTYDSAIRENTEILAELNSLVLENSDQKIVLDDIRELQKYWVDEFAAPLLEAKAKIVSEKDKILFNKLYREKLGNRLDKDVQVSLQKKFSEFTNQEYVYRASGQESLALSVSHTKSISFYLTIISIGLGGCIAIFIARYVSTRLMRMVNMANEIAAGNYDVNVQTSGQSEISQLAIALNNMAGILGTNFTLLKRQRDELDQFAHIVSHDLKAPLRGIDNIVTWIEEDHSFQMPPKVLEYIALIKGRIIRAESLLKGILMYARVGRQKPPNEIVDVNSLITDISVDIATRKSITLEIQSEMPVLFTQRTPLEQVFSNLIVNAFKYHDKENGFVRVYYRLDGQYYRFFVEDNGPGIPKIYHDRVFRIFQTLQERDTVESVGVGLAIVKKILEDRNLQISITTSRPESGTVFSFTWPANENHETNHSYSADRR